MFITVALVAAGTFADAARAEKITVGIAQTVIENTLDQQRDIVEWLYIHH